MWNKWLGVLEDGRMTVTQSPDDIIAQLDKMIVQVQSTSRKLGKRGTLNGVSLDTSLTLEQMGAKPILKALLESVWVSGQYKFENGQYVRVSGAPADSMVSNGYSQFLYIFN
jgi:hypothetical protein